MPTTSRQKGFTLIELMVVVVIIAVVLAAGLMSFGSHEGSQLRAQWAKTQGLIQTACDQAAFKQRLVLIGIDEQGLKVYYQTNGQWTQADNIKTLSWSPGFEVQWRTEPTMQERMQLPQPGWLCWPGGLITEGEIRADGQILAWDQALKFEWRQDD
ncbi:MAG: prepilin-type N-terminal cleavage/methylation domain-containing protein [Thiomicrospira sp.]|uniref:prepilin-type N-terminal cleavage/methylation domain-containing protein n=1 Tax=Thiomicrospira sp. TaxID=935 RepID=UPI0019DF3BB1|nr:prepilin-type N-terminal cleavage/methylation domain-containing protein [Thiomicrospira sp.]MBE0494039.1 prepilin-type N-terminal cleavage/methylation domain-containing protein [Thiomicrospira sp.]